MGKRLAHAGRFSIYREKTTRRKSVFFYLIERWWRCTDKLTEKQKRFIDAYIETANGAEAARRAGYSEKTARDIATENLAKPNIQKEIEKRTKELETKRIASAQEVLEGITAIARGDKKEETLTVVNGEFVRAEREIAARDRLKAFELLGKRYRLFAEDIRLQCEEAPKIIDDVVADDE